MGLSCIRRIERYLREGRRRLRRSLGVGPPLRLVLGSPTADPDSLAASIAYAFLLRLASGQREMVLPWIPIPRRDLRLRPEALLLFRRAGLSLGPLLYTDDLDPALVWKPSLILVDSDGAWLPAPLRERIVEVLDHHPGSWPPPGALCRLEPVGSACTLVAERFFAFEPGLVDPGLALLLLGPILLDTAALDPAAGRAAEKDRQIASRLAAIAGSRADRLYERLIEARRELPGLTTFELLRRDYKEGEAGGIRYGISSSTVGAERWRRRDPTLEDGIRSFREERGVELLLVMIAIPGEVFRRQLIVSAPDTGLAASATGGLQGLGLRLSPLPGHGSADLRFFEQLSSEISRKRLEPLLRGWLASGRLAGGGPR